MLRWFRKSALAQPVVDTIAFQSPRLDRAGVVVETVSGHSERMTVDLGAGVALELIRVPGGAYDMGSASRLLPADEQPAHRVRVRDFWLGRHPITQAQWRAVIRKLPYCRFDGYDLPVDGVTCAMADRFVEQLASKSGMAFRLPSEAEWEYACRAGTGGPFSFGETLTSEVANYNAIHTYADEPAGPYRHMPLTVGTLPPNAFGLGEMHGSMWEWCADVWHEDYAGAPTDGAAWSRGASQKRVLRGGSWHDPPGMCRSAVRVGLIPTEGEEMMGVRMALSATKAV